MISYLIQDVKLVGERIVVFSRVGGARLGQPGRTEGWKLCNPSGRPEPLIVASLDWDGRATESDDPGSLTEMWVEDNDGNHFPIYEVTLYAKDRAGGYPTLEGWKNEMDESEEIAE